MRVDHSKVEFAGDQEDHGLDGGQAGEASGAAFGGLEQAVDSLQKAIGLAGLRPGHDALQMTAHECRDFLHGFDLGPHHTGAPMPQQRAYDVDLLALQDLAQLERDTRVGEVIGTALDEGGRHVDADRLDLLGRAAVRVQVGRELLDGVNVAPFGDAQHAARDRDRRPR